MNKVITSEIAEAVLKEKAKFLCWTGDLVSGYDKEPSVFESQLMTWRGLMEPVYRKHIPILAVRGNHDSSSTDATAVWRRVFSGPYAMPDNGPDAEKDLTFFFGKGEVMVIGLDQYGSINEEVDQHWLEQTLEAHPKRFVFAFAHEPAFMDGSHADTMDRVPALRNAFWESLIKAGSRVFFCGHDHLYDRMLVHRAEGDPGPDMYQVVAGTAGAPFYKEGPYAGKHDGWNLTRVTHIDSTYGYTVVTIDGRKATITFKGRTAPGVYVPMDVFTIQAPGR